MNTEIINKIRGITSISLLQFSTTLTVITVLLFCITQLAINANLNPKGIKLESLNTEKNALIEENRKLEQEIAQSRSIKIITQISASKLSLSYKGISNTIYLSVDDALLAQGE